ncbi:MAG: hypothetical protein HY075_06890 [Deltaproteobacteria bacterium]|nr:hypothetical protein [Deltaproteobacteria bacterium]
MKNLLLAIAALTSLTAQAAPQEIKRVLKDTVTPVVLDLNPKTVFCTDRGYGNIQLKVSVPDLDWLAHFNHRVEGEGQPCITGGRCSETLNPGKILDPNDRFVVVPVRVVLTEVIQLDRDARTCQHALLEKVESQIRGVRFNHSRGNDFVPLEIEKCEKLL